MALTPAQITALQNEINTDPQTLGYAAPKTAGNLGGILAILNLLRADGAVTYHQYVGPIASYLVVNATVPAELAALTSTQLTQYQILTGPGVVDTSNANVRSQFAALFGAGTATRTALTALTTRQGSRAELLLGVGVVLGTHDLEVALNGVTQ